MSSAEYQDVARVTAITHYPVKSLAGVSVDQAWIGWHGLDGDRRYAFIKLRNKTGFPWLTARDAPELTLYRAYFEDQTNARGSAVWVKSPDGSDLAVDSPELLKMIEQVARQEIHLLHNWTGVFDTMDLSIISRQSINGVSDQIGQLLDVRRFRANIVVEALDNRPFPEERWLKSLLVFGDRSDPARVRAHRKDVRCMVVNLDPETSEQNPEILKAIVATRKNQLGVYCSTERPGSVAVGDIVRLAS